MRYFTSDLHLAHPFVAATRGFWKPGMRPDRDIIEEPDGIVLPSKGSIRITGASLYFFAQMLRNTAKQDQQQRTDL